MLNPVTATKNLRGGLRWFVSCVLAVQLVARAAEAQNVVPEETASATSSGGLSPLSRLTETWDGLHKRLDDAGIQFGIRYDGEVFSNTVGGARRGSGYLGNLNLQLTFDAERLVGWPGATVFLYGLGTHGGHPSAYVGDAQGVSNIEAPAKWKLEEGWLQQNLFDNRLSFLFGRYDLNSEFYRLQSAGLFLNSSFGIGPEFSQSGADGPSIFPNTAVGSRLAFKPMDEIVLRAAVLDGVPVQRANGSQHVFAKDDGVLIVTEAAYLYRPTGAEQPRTREFRIGRNCCGAYTAKLAVGAWYYTARFDDLATLHTNGEPIRRRGGRGFYLVADGVVYQDAQNPDRQLTAFGQFGIGDPRVYRFAYYTGGGLTVSALLPGRSQDQLGLAVAAAHNGDPYIEALRFQGMRARRSEVSFELTYLAQFGAHFALQPDLQFILNPSTDPKLKNALALMLRFEVSF